MGLGQRFLYVEGAADRANEHNETLINPLFTDGVFRRESEGDGSGHYEPGGSCPIDPGTNPPFRELFSPFSNLIRHLFSIKMKEIIKKLKIKVSGRCRERFIVPIRWHPFNNLN